MTTCDKCGNTVKAFWRCYSKYTFKHIDLCNHHMNEYHLELMKQRFTIILLEEIVF